MEFEVILQAARGGGGGGMARLNSWVPIVSLLGTLVFYAIMSQVQRAMKSELKEISAKIERDMLAMKSEWKESLRDAVERQNDEVLRVHTTFDEDVKAIDVRAAAAQLENNSHFMELRRRMDDQVQALGRLAEKYAEADKSLALMQQRLDFEFGELSETTDKRRRSTG